MNPTEYRTSTTLDRWWKCAAVTMAVALSGVAAPMHNASAAMFKPSASEQKKLGADAAREIERKYKKVTGPQQDRVERVGARLIRALDAKNRSTWNYKFQLLESKELNAFALPGGPMYVYTGLLNRMKSDDELAAVMGHELAHVYKEHWARMTAESQKRSLGLLAVLSVTKANKNWYNAAGLANSIADLRYSRKDETEADDNGFNNMVRAGFNPQGMVDLFRTLQAGSKDPGLPDFLRSHPVTADRVKRTQERIAKTRR